jgi:polyribonucleotide nucleotidyltransferase
MPDALAGLAASASISFISVPFETLIYLKLGWKIDVEFVHVRCTAQLALSDIRYDDWSFYGFNAVVEGEMKERNLQKQKCLKPLRFCTQNTSKTKYKQLRL